MEGRDPWNSDDGNDLCETVKWTLNTKLLYDGMSGENCTPSPGSPETSQYYLCSG